MNGSLYKHCAQQESLLTISLRQHVMNDLRPYICTYPECRQAKKQYRSRMNLANHENWHHVTPTALTGPVNCPFCQKEFPTWRSRGRIWHFGHHMEEIAFAVVPKVYEDWDFYSNSSGSQLKPFNSHAFACTFTHCSEWFGNESDRIEHQNIEHCSWHCREPTADGTGPCNERFGHERVFQVHLRNYHSIKDENTIQRKCLADKRHCPACTSAECKLRYGGKSFDIQ